MSYRAEWRVEMKMTACYFLRILGEIVEREVSRPPIVIEGFAHRQAADHSFRFQVLRNYVWQPAPSLLGSE